MFRKYEKVLSGMAKFNQTFQVMFQKYSFFRAPRLSIAFATVCIQKQQFYHFTILMMPISFQNKLRAEIFKGCLI